MKKAVSTLLALVLAICLAISFGGCGDGTIYDGKEIAKIETKIAFGEVRVYYDPVRTFDFSAGTVTDTVSMDDEQIRKQLLYYNDNPSSFPEYETADDYEKFLKSYYNSTEKVADFTREQSDAFLKDIVSSGIYTWEDEYDENSYSCGSWHYITIFFTDGEQKTTRFYDVYPDNYKAIEKAFKERLGTGIYCEK